MTRVTLVQVISWAILTPVWAQEKAPPTPEDLGVRFSTTVIEPLFGSTTVSTSGLIGKVYSLPPQTSAIPTFEELKPVGTIYTDSLNVPPQRFEIGFPGVSNLFEWFAIDYTGRFYIVKPGVYSFVLLSDDGTRLSIDRHVVINNDGIHPPRKKEGARKLARGVHDIRVSYFQGPRFEVALMLGIRPPGGREWKIFKMSDYRPPQGQ